MRYNTYVDTASKSVVEDIVGKFEIVLIGGFARMRRNLTRADGSLLGSMRSEFARGMEIEGDKVNRGQAF
jgi:hypothetical protein